ncbi:hypothetical protein [Aurantiacibacter zhengii]|uniref:Lipoprotein n=1 Tax=Aurantiacibacter zhengii TaxID=2307003 RepID=A0A418NWM2_9SPHN|nr:hypothetical protein [Aurantiacibacter zhengii]RIV88993.1 hypothetical protein D2V07_01640 [Aurantiacibacter zhengii]
MKTHSLLRVACFALAAFPIAACTTIPDAPIVSNGPAAPAGTSVGIGKPVWTGRIVATPMEVHEDSRCPANAQCVWVGQVVVLTRIDGAGWRESVYLKPGEPHATHGTTLTLASVSPERMTGEDIRSADYRFTYVGGE